MNFVSQYAVWTVHILSLDHGSCQQQIGLKFKEETSELLIWNVAFCGTEKWIPR